MLPSSKNNDQDTAGIWRMASVGWTLVCEIIAGMVLGYGVDWLAGTDRVFLVIGAIGGVLVGMTGFIRSALAENRRMERERKRKS